MTKFMDYVITVLKNADFTRGNFRIVYDEGFE
jgi:hypothetical protein